MSTKGNVCGEGNHEASRRYDEAGQMKHAEEAALLRAKNSPPPARHPWPRSPVVEDPHQQTQGRHAPKPR